MRNFIKIKIFSHWLYRGPPFGKLRAGSFENRERWGILIYDGSVKCGPRCSRGNGLLGGWPTSRISDLSLKKAGCPISRVLCEKWGS
jgi:hypothetical protein